nr:hypothetical protein [Tanacetum cinerariifolium]
MFQWRLPLPMLWCHSMMELVAMIEAFRLMKNQQILPSWHLPPQAHQVLQGLIMSSESYDSVPTSHVNDRYKSGSGPKWLFDIDTLTKSMNYQPVVVGNQPNHNVGVRDLRDEFEEISVNSTNRVNAASAPVIAVGPNSTNSTNSFKATSFSDNAVSLNFEISGKSSFVDPSQYPDDPDIRALEDIIYSNDEEDVGAEADFFNLETHISGSPIPTTRVHKDYTVT